MSKTKWYSSPNGDTRSASRSAKIIHYGVMIGIPVVVVALLYLVRS